MKVLNQREALKRAKKYSCRVELRDNDATCYFWLYRHNLLSKAYPQIKKLTPNKNIKEYGFWNFERCLEFANSCENLAQFWRNKGASKAASNKGWMPIIKKRCPHLNQLSYKKWSFDRCLDAAKKCKTNSEFYKKYQSAYNAAQKNNWLPELRKGFIKQVDTKEQIYKNSFTQKLQSIKNIKIEREKSIPIRDNEPGRVDYLITIPEYNLVFVLEIKHDDCRWGEQKIQQQINKYNRAYRERNGFCGTYIVSPKGRYGFSERQILEIIKKMASSGIVYLPNSLDFIKNNDKILK